MHDNNRNQRKHLRLKSYDYSDSGGYFVTICTQNRRCVLSRIAKQGISPAEIHLTEYGRIAESQLSMIPKRFPTVRVDTYAIMPNHIHALLHFTNSIQTDKGPTLMDVLGAYKSLTTKACNEAGFFGKLFQTSFYEHIIRDQNDYEEKFNYIVNNPERWADDDYYCP